MHSTLPSPIKNRGYFFLPLLLLTGFVFWRLAIFALAHPVYFHDDYEEVYRGTVARELALGTNIPLWNYRPDNYAGGFYVIVTLLPIFHKLFGFSMLGLKAFGITQTALTMLVWYAVLVRYVNQRTAVIFSLLYLFAPFRYVTLSSLVFGDHAETCLLSALTVLLFFRMNESKSPRFDSFLALGLLAGFSLWFAYIYGVTLAALAVMAFLNKQWAGFNKRTILIVLGAFLTGFSFWLLFNFRENFSGLVIQGMPVWEMINVENLMKPFVSWREFFIFRLLSDPEVPYLWSASFNLVLLGYVILYGVFAVAFGIQWILLKKSNFQTIRQSPVGLSLIYCVIFLTIQQMFEMVGLRFLVPFFPFALVLIAYGFAEMSRSRKLLAGLGVSSLIILAVLSCLLRFAPSHFGEFLSRKGYSIKTLGHATWGMRSRIEKVFAKNFEQLRKTDKTGYIMAFVDQLELEEDKIAEEVLGRAHFIPKEFHGYYGYLAGREVMYRYPDVILAMNAIEPLRERNPDVYRQMSRGIFSAMEPLKLAEIEGKNELKENLSRDIAPKLSIYEGFRFAEDKLKERNQSAAFFEILQKKAEELSAVEKEYFLFGAGRSLFRSWVRDPHHPPIRPEDFKNFPIEIRTLLYRGVAAQMLRRHILSYSSSLVWSWNEFLSKLSNEDQKEMVAALNYALERWGLSEAVLPTEKLQELKKD